MVRVCETGADLEHAALERVEVIPARLGDGRLLDNVAHTERVHLVDGHRDRILLHDRVVVAIDARIDADRENVLVIGGKHARRNNIAVRRRLVGLDVGSGQDTRCARLDMVGARLVQLESKDVLVVGHCGERGSSTLFELSQNVQLSSKSRRPERLTRQDHLDDQHARSCYTSIARAPVGVLELQIKDLTCRVYQ